MGFPFWPRKRRNEELNEEIQAHLTLAEREEIASGRSRKEAQFAARHEFGNVTHAAEVTREMWSWRWLADIFQDARFAIRTLRQKPGFFAVALLTLALGIGVTTIMFTVVNGVLLKPLMYPDPGKLTFLSEKTDQATRMGNLWSFTYPNFLDAQSSTTALDMAAWQFAGGAVREPGKAEHFDGREVSAGFFPTLGVNMLRGRSFSPDEDHLGGTPVIILSERLARKLFGSADQAFGKTVVLDETPRSVVGVLPPDFRWMGNPILDVFTPLGQDPAPNLQKRDRHGLGVLARLRPGATWTQAEQQLTAVASGLARQFPDSNKGRTFALQPFAVDTSDVSSMLWILLSAVGLVLLIACANVANLLLVRAVAREREFAMRTALGAGHGRLIRQCLTESAILGLAGGALGVMVAAVGVRPFVAFWPGSLPRADEVHMDWRVLLFAVGASLFCGFLFGLAPALRIPTRDVEQRLRGGQRSVGGHSRRLHGTFVVAEIALAVVLVVSAGILGRTLIRLASLNPGVDVHNVLTGRMSLAPSTLANPDKILPAWRDVLDHARRVPGIEDAAIVDIIPMREGNNSIPFWPTSSFPPGDAAPEALATCVTPDFQKVMGVPLLAGRFIDDHDRRGGEPVVVIDEVLAKQAFGNANPVGKQLWLDGRGSPFTDGANDPEPVRVIGLVGHVRYWGPAGDDSAKIRAEFYYPFEQVYPAYLHRWSELMSIAVRTTVPPMSVVEPLEKEVRGPGGDQVMNEVLTMEQIASDSLIQHRTLMLLFGVFAGLALLLACIGIYGVLAYLAGERVPEIGLRMALGASPGSIVRLVLKQSLWMVAGGVAVGVFGAYAAARLLQRYVVGIHSFEPVTFAGMVALLVAAALAASFIPARRASRVDPLIALRHE
jgi:predicted permease